ncbi:MAG TPA: DNA-formamidopyrimidine glycosylase family protein [Acidobacteriaceae bacterium]
MPEGDTIFRAARALGQALTGKVVTSFETALAQLASVDDNQPIAGRSIDRIEARGKWLLIYFSGDLILATHMLMSGSWHIYRTGERWRAPARAMRAVLRTADFEAVAFNVPLAKFFTARTLARNSAIPALGPDLLGASFAAEDARPRILARGDDEIANVLLNQRVMAGLGNVYKVEVCFLCGIHPFRKVSTLTPAELDCVLHQSRRLILQNVQESSGDQILTYTGARRTTGRADHGARLWAYGRQGEPCRRCGAAILMRKQGPDARSTYWCPQCQPADSPVPGWANPSARKRVGCT